MSKQIVIRATCSNVDADIADSFHAELDEGVIELIRKYAQAAKDLSAYAISVFNYTGNFSSHWIDGVESNVEEDLPQVIADIEEAIVRTDCDCLNVSDDEFWWTAYPKHCTSGEKLSTSRIPIAFLDNDDEVYLEWE